MKKDITTRADIKLIITKFYNKLIADKEMLPFFEEIIAQNHLEKHLEVVTDFWEDMLFHSYKYKNNPMQKHIDFAKKMPFTKRNFTLWLNYLNDSIDNHFEGESAHIMKTRAQSISTIMQLKLDLYNKNTDF